MLIQGGLALFLSRAFRAGFDGGREGLKRWLLPESEGLKGVPWSVRIVCGYSVVAAVASVFALAYVIGALAEGDFAVGRGSKVLWLFVSFAAGFSLSYLVNLALAVGLLEGAPWARFGFVVFSALGAIVVLAQGNTPGLIALVVPGIMIWLLMRPRAREFFANQGRGGRGA